MVLLAFRRCTVLLLQFAVALPSLAGAGAASSRLTSKPTAGLLLAPCKKEIPSGLSFEEAKDVATTNFGNLVWLNAAVRLLDPEAVNLQCVTHSGLINGDESALAGVLYPQANWVFNVTSPLPEWQQALQEEAAYMVNVFENTDAPVLVAGVGIQAEFTGGDPDMFQMDPTQIRVFKTVQERTDVIAVRGSYTASVFHHHGLEAAVATGCPSLFWNHNPFLGRIIEEKLRAIPSIPADELKVGITLFRGLVGENVAVVADILQRFPHSKIILQASEDPDKLQLFEYAMGAPLSSDRVLHFYDPIMWQQELKQFDMVIGHRIHGSMMSLAAEVPMIVFPGDHRIMELASTMKLPVMDHLRFADRRFDLYEAARTVEFSGEAFDCNRRSVATLYKSWFRRHGLLAHAGVQMLAGGLDHEYTVEDGVVVTTRCSLE